jgi:hypothetical protein
VKYARGALGALLGAGGVGLILIGGLAIVGYFGNDERDGVGLLVIAWASGWFLLPGAALCWAGRRLLAPTTTSGPPPRRP